MSITKQIIDANTQVPMTYHVVLIEQTSYLEKLTRVNYASFYSEAAFLANGRPLNQDQIAIPGIAPRGVERLDWIQQQLVAAADDSANPVQYPNRWLFSGGTINDFLPEVAAVVDTPPVVTDPTPPVVTDPTPPDDAAEGGQPATDDIGTTNADPAPSGEEAAQ